jgi:hypothetical protein
MALLSLAGRVSARQVSGVKAPMQNFAGAPCLMLEVVPPRLRRCGAAVRDPLRRFATFTCRVAKGLLDHLVGDCEQRGRHGETERLGRFEVNDQFEPGRSLDRQITRPLAF